MTRRRCFLVWMLLAALVGTKLPAAPLSYSCRFVQGGWNDHDWIPVKSPRWDRLGGWIQRPDFIENETPPDVPAPKLRGKRAGETYSSMVWKTRVSGTVTITTTLAFEERMAPLIVIAPTLGKDDKGRPEYREHFEIVLYDKGINVWHHQWKNGKPSWKKAAWWLFPVTPKDKHVLQVRIKPTARGKTLVIDVDGREMGYIDDSLPDECYVGITGCEGINHFYDFSVKSLP